MRQPDFSTEQAPTYVDDPASVPAFQLEFFGQRTIPGVSFENTESSGIKDAILRWLDEQL